MHGEVSPVLAQAFTEPFTVYSAKRFPGVPGKIKTSVKSFYSPTLTLTALPPTRMNVDTTALSIAFGNQGQKLPLVSFPPNATSSFFRLFPFWHPLIKYL